MPTQLRVRQNGRYWVPDHEGLSQVHAWSPPPDTELRGSALEAAARQALWEAIEYDQPGLFTIELELEVLRGRLFAVVDARTDALIAAGFVFEGNVFSCSLEAQIRMTNMMLFADTFPYPYRVSSLDDRAQGVLTNADHMRAWCQTALGHIAQTVGYGTVLKKAVQELTTVQEALAFEDPRPAPVDPPKEPNP